MSGGGPPEWDSCPYQRGPNELPGHPLTTTTQGRSEKLAVCTPEDGLHQNPTTLALGSRILNFQPAELGEMKVCCFKASSSVVLQQPE